MLINASNMNAAFLVENGFCEREFVQAETSIKKLGLNSKIVSANTALVEAWREEKGSEQSNWGQKYASQGLLNEQNPTDYDVLVIPGGTRSIDKLIQEPNLRPFLSGFLSVGKPVLVYNKAVDLLLHHDLLKDYSVAARDQTCDILNSSGSRCASSNLVVSKNLITLSRYRDVEEKICHAITAILNGEPYVEKVVSSDNLPKSHQAA